MMNHRNLMLTNLMKSPYDLDLWIPKGGYFVLADISRTKIDDKYMVDENGEKRTRDVGFAFQMVH